MAATLRRRPVCAGEVWISNPVTGDFSRGAAGLWIEQGELTYPVNEINIAGTLQEMLADTDAVGNDARFVDTVSAPTFRIARMMVSGH